MTETRPISGLRWDDLFVRTLPADPSDDPRPRQVRGVCHSLISPTPSPAPKLVHLVPEVAEFLGLSTDVTPELVDVLSGRAVAAGMRPYAACYGGHQFGQWAGQLGDGRAITLGETITPRGERWELQLKGSGRTPYSRTADGRAVLRSSIRELVASEAMFHLGVPTTRALSLVTTGEDVLRDLLYDGHPAFEPGAIVCRVAPSFLRFGSFEIHTARGDFTTLRALAEHTITTHYPELGPLSPESIVRMFELVAERTATMIVEWLRVGFVHGVMNTDNMSILGLTIDYGPYGFLDGFDLDWTPNTTDAGQRRYRFGHQSRIARWNLGALAHALAPLAGSVEVFTPGLERYDERVSEGTRVMMLAKVGLTPGDDLEGELDFLNELFNVLWTVETDMTLFFRRLAELPVDRAPRLEALADVYYPPVAEIGASERTRIEQWLGAWAERARRGGLPDDERRARMNRVNPIYVPRNYLAQEVIDAATAGDFTPLARWMDVLRRPYEVQPGAERFAAKRPEWARRKPGCSMLSCSS
ncbi:YdiU family protein [Myxococcota bacterium]|nr:YdiU family protein [Myxococcota bacterium]